MKWYGLAVGLLIAGFAQAEVPTCEDLLGAGIQTIGQSGVMTFEKNNSRLLNVDSGLRFNFPNKTSYKDNLHCYPGDPGKGEATGSANECQLVEQWQANNANFMFPSCTNCNSHSRLSSGKYTLDFQVKSPPSSLVQASGSNITLTNPNKYYFNELTLNTGTILNVPGGSDLYVQGDFTLDGGIVVTGSGTVRLFINGSLTIDSNSKGLNASGSPDQLVIWVSGNVTILNSVTVNGSIIQDDGNDAQQQSFTIGHNSTVRGLISVDGSFHLGNSDIIIDQSALDADFGDICTKSSKEISFNIDVSQTQALTCEAINVTLTVNEESARAINYEGSVTLSSSSTIGEWIKPTSAKGVLSSSINGTATYTFSSEDDGLAILQFRHPASGSTVLSITSADGTISASSPAITFRLEGFEVSFNPEYPVANTPFDLIVQAVAATPDNPQECSPVVDYTGNKSLELNMVYSDYNQTAGVPLTFEGVDINPVGQPGLTRELTFDSNGKATASEVLNFADVGEIAVHVNDPTSAVEESGVGSVTIVPYQVLVADVRHCDGGSNPKNPAGTATFGNGFVAAGESFSAIVVATIADCSISANVCSNTVSCSAPSFAEPISLSAELDTPVNGSLGALSSTTQPFTHGAAVAELTYDEVGSINLQAEMNNFLGSGIDYSDSVRVGRFYPDYLELVDSSLDAACDKGSTHFSYLGDSSQRLSYSLEAKNRAGQVTQNYDSILPTAGGLGYLFTAPTSAALYHLIDASAGSLLGRFVLSGDPGLNWARGEAKLEQVSFNVTKQASYLGTPYNETHLGLELQGPDGETFRVFDFDCTLDENCEAVELGQLASLRYGRLAIANGYGPINQSLHIPLSWEYWNGTQFVTNTDDSCSELSLKTDTLRFFPWNGSSYVFAPYSAIPIGDAGNTSASLTNDWDSDKYVTTTAESLISNEGRAWIRYAAPNDSGHVRHIYVFKDVRDGWLRFDWDDNPATGDDQGNDATTSGIASFGSIRGSDRVISRKEL